MEKCIGCNYYDRGGKETDARGMQWGQCRRAAPRLHPINQKTYMIEGVWPSVRDDDWCGEWKAAVGRRAEARVADTVSLGPLIPVPTGAALGARPAPKAVPAANLAYGAQAIGGSLMSSSGGDD